MPEKRYVKEQKIAQATDIPVKTLRNERSLRKGFPFVKRGRSVYYDLDEVLRAMEADKVKTVN